MIKSEASGARPGGQRSTSARTVPDASGANDARRKTPTIGSAARKNSARLRPSPASTYPGQNRCSGGTKAIREDGGVPEPSVFRVPDEPIPKDPPVRRRRLRRASGRRAYRFSSSTASFSSEEPNGTPLDPPPSCGASASRKKPCATTDGPARDSDATTRVVASFALLPGSLSGTKRLGGQATPARLRSIPKDPALSRSLLAPPFRQQSEDCIGSALRRRFRRFCEPRLCLRILTAGAIKNCSFLAIFCA